MCPLQDEQPGHGNEPLPVKRTGKRYKVFPAGSQCAASRFLCSREQCVLFHRCQYTQVALYPSGIVIADVALDHLNKFLLAGKTLVVIAFPFQNAPESLHGAVVNTVSHAGHTLLHSGLYELLVECSTGILETSVAVEQRMGIRISFHRLIKCLVDEGIVITLT